MGRLTVITLTLNEEQNIAECLASIQWADECLVLDSGSSDRTVEIAKRFTPHVQTIEWKGYGAARNRGLAAATGDWVLWLDADERITPGLAEEIRRIVARDDEPASAFAIARRAYFLGRWIRHCGWYPSRVPRLFRKGKARFTESLVHERLEVDGPVAVAENDLLHYTDPTLKHYFTKFNRYTTLAAEDLLAAGRRASILDLALRPPYQFLKMFILRLGLLDGVEGFILCVLSSAYVFTKYAKLWELQRQKHR